ncbi:hypothetical protein [uncultured Microbacterium sp.]|uniref:hypothetical protein n=1 Tax=uncultured Microbacterium sp. TaxID=191216 RepID=UPI00260656D8|nr:hypothetical protein [uncultured Microbacterium sp.]
MKTAEIRGIRRQRGGGVEPETTFSWSWVEFGVGSEMPAHGVDCDQGCVISVGPLEGEPNGTRCSLT